jgi:hypothetical protein
MGEQLALLGDHRADRLNSTSRAGGIRLQELAGGKPSSPVRVMAVLRQGDARHGARVQCSLVVP